MKNWLTNTSRRARQGLVAAAFVGAQLLGPISPFITPTAHAATQHAGPWMFFAFNDRATNSDNGKHIDLPGSTNTYHGPIKSNGDFDVGGSGNIFNGIVRQHDNDGNPKISDNTYNAGNPAFEAASATWPGTLQTLTVESYAAQCMFGNFTTSPNHTITTSSPDGVYCTDNGTISVPNQNVEGKFTFLSKDGLILFNGSNFDVEPYIDNILAFTNQNDDEFGIDVTGSTGSTMKGLLYAKQSDIKFQGSNTTYCVQAAGLNVVVSGSTSIFNTNCVPPDTGSVQVNKQVDTDGNGTYEGGNTEANNLGFDWGLDSETPVRDMGTTLSNVTPGSHSVTEDSVANYSFTGWFTTGSTQNSCTNPQGTTLPVPITVVANQTTSITLCNARDTAQIRIIKQTNPTNDPGQFNLQLDNVTKATGGHGTDTQFITVPTGNYTVSETAGANTDLNNYGSSVDCGAEGSAAATTIQVGLSKNEQVTCTFTNIRKGSISGTKCEVNVGATTCPGGTGLQGWTIFIDANGNGQLDTGEQSTTTDANGNYSFSNLLPGSVTLEEVIIDINAWTKVFGPAPFTLSAGQNATGKDFGNFRHGSINGFKFNDVNGNGNYDNEPKLQGWTITLFNDNNDPDNDLNNQVAQITTDVNGNYSFSNLAPDTYAVCETLQTGWVQTTPVSNGGCHIIVINESGETNPNTNFGNFQEATIDGFKWHDLNGDGLFVATEPKLSGWTIFIDENSNSILNVGEESTATDANGNYSFSNLEPGTYRICEVQQTNWTQTFPAANGCHSITVQSGQTNEANFGNKRDTGTIIVKKELIPANDSGRFNLHVNSDTVAQNVGDGGQGNKVVETGNHSVSETGFGSTSLSGYETTYACTVENANQLLQLDVLLTAAVIASGSGTTIQNVEVNKDDTVTCTFTNKKKEGQVLGVVTPMVKPAVLPATGENLWMNAILNIIIMVSALSVALGLAPATKTSKK